MLNGSFTPTDLCAPKNAKSTQKIVQIDRSKLRSDDGGQARSPQSSYQIFKFHKFGKGITLKDQRLFVMDIRVLDSCAFLREPFFFGIRSQVLLSATRIPHIMPEFAFQKQIT
jgi:hypothetical protein